MSELNTDYGHPSLQVDQDLKFQRLQWSIQRVARWVLLIVIVLAVLGMLGPGLLSKDVAADPAGAVSVEYDRFDHQSACNALRLTVRSQGGQERFVRVWLNQSYLERVEILEISPPPTSVETRSGRRYYSFAADPAEPFELTIRYEHQEWGRAEGEIGVADGPGARFTQTVYP